MTLLRRDLDPGIPDPPNAQLRVADAPDLSSRFHAESNAPRAPASERGVARALMLIAEIAATSIVAEALFTFGWRRAFDRYWGHLGEGAAAVVEPAWGAVDAFAVLAVLVLLFSVPLWILMYGLLYLLPKRWFEWGRPDWLPDDWLRKNPLISRRQAVRFICVGLGLVVVGWPLFFLINGWALFTDVHPPFTVAFGIIPYAVAAVQWYRALTPRSRIGMVVASVAIVMVAPTVVATFVRPRIELPSLAHDGSLLFEADGLAVAHAATPTGERPVVILGSTVLGDIVVYDACNRPDHANVVDRDDIIVPETLGDCP